MGRVEYDEMAYFRQNTKEEFGLPWTGPPVVERRTARLADGRTLSGLRWGSLTPEVVLLHGGAQNAHTWDTVCLALALPAFAADLPGHGHSGPGANGSIDVRRNAVDVGDVIEEIVGGPVHLVGMSLGGLTALALSEVRPELVRSVLLVDITPGVTPEKSGAISAFVNGPETFPSFEDLLERTITFNPSRSVASLRRGILHNAVEQPDGSWRWRYLRFTGTDTGEPVDPRFGDLWMAVSALKVPLCLARGLRSQSVVVDEDEAELLRRQPTTHVEHFAEAGHSLQGDTPLGLAALIADFVA